MTDAGQWRPGARLARQSWWLALAVLLSGCTRDDASDYCKNHYRFHEQHRSSLATLDIGLDEDGVLSSRLTLPRGTFFDPQGTEQLLLEAGSVYGLQTTRPCRPADGKVERVGEDLLARYASECGAETKVEQVDVLLFDSLPDLDEVLVSVTTPATAKRFAISRQCDQALFRLDGISGQ